MCPAAMKQDISILKNKLFLMKQFKETLLEN